MPYYSGYYGRVGDRMLVAYPGYDNLLLAESFGDPMWDVAKLSVMAGAGVAFVLDLSNDDAEMDAFPLRVKESLALERFSGRDHEHVTS